MTVLEEYLQARDDHSPWVFIQHGKSNQTQKQFRLLSLRMPEKVTAPAFPAPPPGASSKLWLVFPVWIGKNSSPVRMLSDIGMPKL